MTDAEKISALEQTVKAQGTILLHVLNCLVQIGVDSWAWRNDTAQEALESLATNLVAEAIPVYNKENERIALLGFSGAVQQLAERWSQAPPAPVRR